VRDQVSHPYKTTGKTIVMYTLVLVFLDSKLEDKRLCTEWQQAFPDLKTSPSSSKSWNNNGTHKKNRKKRANVSCRTAPYLYSCVTDNGEPGTRQIVRLKKTEWSPVEEIKMRLYIYTCNLQSSLADVPLLFDASI
jgi:hypothetical protein